MNICFENSAVSVRIDLDGRVHSFLDKKSNTDIISPPGVPFCVLITEDNDTVLPDSVSFQDNCFRVSFGSSHLTLRLETFDRFFIFTVTELPDTDYRRIRLADFRFNYNYEDADVTAVSGYAMNILINPLFYPGGAMKAVGFECHREVPAVGARFALITAPYTEQRQIIKELNERIPHGDLPISKAGGAYALDTPAVNGDYLITSDSDPSAIAQMIDFYNHWQVDQLDFHQGSTTFRQGDFRFSPTHDAADFRVSVAEPLKKAGILSGLHTYSFYIDYEAAGILADPKWQQQLEVLHRFTLAKDITEEDTEIFSCESLENVSPLQGFVQHNSPLLLIDQEIVRFTLSKDGFISCIRGYSGTVPAIHKAGAKICILGGFYCMIAPIPGSELFYHIAHETARVFNEGGFGMCYLDALDGMTQHVPEDLVWYYTVTFVNEIVRYCKEPPILEYSTMFPALWPARGRGGALDTCDRGFKRWSDLHLAANRKLMSYFYRSTFGWYIFYPSDETYPGNFATKYMYFDDVDYMGTQALAYNQSIVYNGLQAETLIQYPAMQRNMERYREYNSLRKADTVSEAVLAQLRTGKHEWKLVQEKNGPAFTEAAYLRSKMHNLKEHGAFRTHNPFDAQQPFIRIENLQTSGGEDPIPLLTFDPEKPLTEQPLQTTLDRIPRSDHLALRVRICGNGSDNAICIRTFNAGAEENGAYDFLIRLDFTGWREYIIADTDNGELNDIVFPEKKDNLYPFYRAKVNYDSYIGLKVFLSGECRGVRMEKIEAVRNTDRSLHNPSVSVNGERVTFCCTLASTEYLEYIPGTSAKIYDRYGQAKNVEEIRGSLTVPSGDFTASLTEDNPERSPARAVLTFGVYGKTIR